ncbi:MAG: hypothetical protein L0154_08255 [Chloroflexi bacterium]|nr:hypothetical protein [Chloroflexota bacterium]
MSHAYGYNIRADVEFVTPVGSFVEGAAEIQYRRSSPIDYQQAVLIYTSPTSHIRFYRIGHSDLLRVPEVADFFVEGSHVFWQAASHTPMVEIFFFGPVCSLLLERHGIPALHASAVSIDGRAVGFLAASHGGKSTLAAHFIQLGYPMITDDVLPVEVTDPEIRVRPGYPQMKLWHEQAIRFCDDPRQLRRLHQNLNKYAVPVSNFCSEWLPLDTLYLPERNDNVNEVRIDPLTPAAATIELMRYAFSAGVMSVLADQRQRWKLFANITRQVGVKRLIYPSGLENLPRVQDAILHDIWAK